MSFIQKVPKPLKIVCWVQIISAIVSLVAVVFTLLDGNLYEAYSNCLAIALVVLVLVGIKQRSQTVRTIAQILAVLSAIFAGIVVTIIFAAMISEFNYPALTAFVIYLISLIGSGLTIWGLSHVRSKHYFRIY